MNSRTIVFGAALPLIALFCLFSSAQKPNSELRGHSNTNAVDQTLVARGKYIVDNVAVCSQCHTPRDAQGNLDRYEWLDGAPVWLLPAQATADWPLQAPRIAGNPPGTDDEMTKLLTSGIWRDGKQLRPPMPQFRLSPEDARAVIAYLKSLTPQH